MRSRPTVSARASSGIVSPLGGAIPPERARRADGTDPDEAIARLAADRMDLVTRADLLRAGVGAKAIAHRVRTGRLLRLHPGVYTISRAPLTFDRRSAAAVLACGDGARLARGFAAALWRMLAEPPGEPEVLRAGARRYGPVAIRLHRTAHLPPHEVTTHRGVPVTTPLRTLLDLAATRSPGLELALNEAQALRLVRRNELEALAQSGRRGAPAIRALLADVPGFTRQAAERRLRRLIGAARLAPPRYNVCVLGRERDAVWPLQRLVVEVDGYAAHGHRRAFEQDRRRDQELAAAGYRTVRITWRQLTTEPEPLIATLAAALAR